MLNFLEGLVRAWLVIHRRVTLLMDMMRLVPNIFAKDDLCFKRVVLLDGLCYAIVSNNQNETWEKPIEKKES